MQRGAAKWQKNSYFLYHKVKCVSIDRLKPVFMPDEIMESSLNRGESNQPTCDQQQLATTVAPKFQSSKTTRAGRIVCRPGRMVDFDLGGGVCGDL